MDEKTPINIHPEKPDTDSEFHPDAAEIAASALDAAPPPVSLVRERDEHGQPDAKQSPPLTAPTADVRGPDLMDFGEVVIFGPSEEPLDIEAALASVSSLDQAIAEQRALEQEAFALQQAEADAVDAAVRRRAAHRFSRPQLSRLARGQLASVIPALVLIALGAWLTLALASGQAPNPVMLSATLTVGVGVILTVYWLASGRWARGGGLIGLTLLFEGGLLIFLVQPGSPSVAGWPFAVVTFGAALFLLALLGQPLDLRLGVMSAALMAAGIVTLTWTTGVLNSDLNGAIRVLWPVPVVISIFLMILPLVARRRG